MIDNYLILINTTAIYLCISLYFIDGQSDYSI